MGLAHLVIDLDELGRRKRYADYNGSGLGSSNPNGAVDYNGESPQQQQQQAYQQGQQSGYQSGYGNGQASVDNQGTAQPTTWINQQGVAPVDPNSYQYGGQQGGAQQFNQGLAQASAAQQQVQGAQIQNANDARDQGNVQGTLGGLSSFYQGQLNGTGPSLAAAQMQQATDQNIAAQQATANSARGSLAGVSAQMGAASNAATAEQNAANQSMQGRIQEEYNAAQGMQGLGSLYEQEQGLNIGQAETQAQLQEQQQLENARLGLGYSGLENQVNQEQLQAQMAQQAQMSGNYQAASGQGMQQGQFNTTQGWNEGMGAAGLGLGLIAAMADADFEEPAGRRGGGSGAGLARATLGPKGYADADAREPGGRGLARLVEDEPARLTLREERTVDGRPFMAIADRNTGVVEKVATKRLSRAEDRRVAAPHGAGPLFADGLARAHSTMHDEDLGSTNALDQPGASMAWSGANDQLEPFASGSMQPGAAAAASPNDQARARLMGLASTMMQPHAAPVYTPYRDLDLDTEERGLARLYTDAKLGSGRRFAHLEHQLAARPGVHDAGALAAAIGRNKLGTHRMAKLAAHGRK